MMFQIKICKEIQITYLGKLLSLIKDFDKIDDKVRACAYLDLLSLAYVRTRLSVSKIVHDESTEGLPRKSAFKILVFSMI